MQLGYGEKEECVQNFDGETCWKTDGYSSGSCTVVCFVVATFYYQKVRSFLAQFTPCRFTQSFHMPFPPWRLKGFHLTFTNDSALLRKTSWEANPSSRQPALAHSRPALTTVVCPSFFCVVLSWYRPYDGLILHPRNLPLIRISYSHRILRTRRTLQRVTGLL